VNTIAIIIGVQVALSHSEHIPWMYSRSGITRSYDSSIFIFERPQ
jgi:hypothetical protein